MNIESLMFKIETFKQLVNKSGFKRDIQEYTNAINQNQNRNRVFMEDLSKRLIEKFKFFNNHSLDDELKILLRKTTPFTSLGILESLIKLNKDPAIDGNSFYNSFSSLLQQLSQSVVANEKEINTVEEIFTDYVMKDETTTASEGQGYISLIFKDPKTIGGLKEFSKSLNRWNNILLMYHSLIKSESPEEITLKEIQNGSIDVIFSINLDVAIGFADIVKVGLIAFGAYLSYKTEFHNIIKGYLGNKILIEGEKEREKEMLKNIGKAISCEIHNQHTNIIKNDTELSSESLDKKVKEIAKTLTDHIVKGNEVKLLTHVKPEPDQENDLQDSLRNLSSEVRSKYKLLEKDERLLLANKYIIKDDDLNNKDDDLNNKDDDLNNKDDEGVSQKVCLTSNQDID